jgi:diguanylate cyclase (GGDEF)-like protein
MANSLLKAQQTSLAIRDLSAAMDEVTVQNRLNTHVFERGHEEIASLVAGFNRMLQQLHQRDEAKQAAETELKKQALFDELTGLPNRRLLMDRLSQSVAASKRTGMLVAVLYIDLDGFKLVNDNLGHQAGDALLKDVARRFESQIRGSDTLARLGGDEFCVVLNQIPSQADAERIAESFLCSLDNKFELDNESVSIGASIGISMYGRGESDGRDLIEQADIAMYAAKHSGKNRIANFEETIIAKIPRPA